MLTVATWGYIYHGWLRDENALIAEKSQNDFSNGIIAAANYKCDSSSTGAITGNILGALLGYQSIEDKWKQYLELSDVILEISDDLCHGCQMSEYSSYRDEDWLRKYVYIDKALLRKI